MKELIKLQINSEKLMKNEELTTLRGGYDSECCECYSLMGGPYYATNSSPSTCNNDCYQQFYGWGTWNCVV
jgi:hypothetical protein